MSTSSIVCSTCKNAPEDCICHTVSVARPVMTAQQVQEGVRKIQEAEEEQYAIRINILKMLEESGMPVLKSPFLPSRSAMIMVSEDIYERFDAAKKKVKG